MKIKLELKNDDLIVILGASDNPMRPSHIANRLLENKGFKTVNIRYENDSNCMVETQAMGDANKTVTIFLKPNQQKKYYTYLLDLKPSRIIFNPGTENEELRSIAVKNNIKVLSGCTIALIMNSMI